jgi:hypothetical protein
MAGSSPAMTLGFRVFPNYLAQPRVHSQRYKSRRFLAENQKFSYACPMTDPAFPYAKIMGPRSHGSETAAKGRAKFLSAKIRRNPLKRLYSDERIQGNPSLSNPQNQGFSRLNSQ